jgi:hypothetical protein
MKTAAMSIVIGALLILWVGEKCSKTAPVVVAPDTELVSANKRLLDQRKADSVAKIQSDSINAALKRFADSQIERRRLAERSATALANRADSAIAALEAAQTSSDSIPPLIEAYTSQRARGDTLSVALSSEKQAHVATSAMLVNVGVSLRSAEISRDSAISNSVRWEADSRRLAAGWNQSERKRRAFPTKLESGIIGSLLGVAGLLGLAQLMR